MLTYNDTVTLQYYEMEPKRNIKPIVTDKGCDDKRKRNIVTINVDSLCTIVET